VAGRDAGLAVGAAGLEAEAGARVRAEVAVVADVPGGHGLAADGDVGVPVAGDLVAGGQRERHRPAVDGRGAGVDDGGLGHVPAAPLALHGGGHRAAAAGAARLGGERGVRRRCGLVARRVSGSHVHLVGGVRGEAGERDGGGRRLAEERAAGAVDVVAGDAHVVGGGGPGEAGGGGGDGRRRRGGRGARRGGVGRAAAAVDRGLAGGGPDAVG